MIYADYAFYTAGYRGTAIPETDYDRLAAMAAAYIDNVTRGQVKNINPVPHNVKMAACAVAEAYQVIEDGEVTSQSVGSWSKHYTKASKNDHTRLFEAAKLFLGDLARRVRWV